MRHQIPSLFIQFLKQSIVVFHQIVLFLIKINLIGNQWKWNENQQFFVKVVYLFAAYNQMINDKVSYLDRLNDWDFCFSSSSEDHVGGRLLQSPLLHCAFCPKSFVFKSDLDKHENIHTKKKKYVCDHCSKSFLHQTSLRVHLR